MDFGDLQNDKSIQEKLTNLHNSIEKIENFVNTALENDIYQKLTLKEKTDYDLFMAYTLNTLFWLYLRSINVEPNENDIKNQLNRIKEYMVKAKQAHERHTIRPTVDKPAADRFIKHGLKYKNDEAQPANKRIKFDN